MLTLLFYLVFFMASSHATDLLDTGWHHIEPLLNEATEAIENPQGEKCEQIDGGIPLTQYVSKEPKQEPWREYYKLPKLLSDKLYKIPDVCEEAKRMNKAQGTDRKYALVVHKGHLCDLGHKACISALKSVSDPCNHFIHDNFQVFHSRGFVQGKNTPGSTQIRETYGSLEPSLIVIRLSDCQPVPSQAATEVMSKGMTLATALKDNFFRTPPSEGNDFAGEPKFRSADDSVRFFAMKESLLKNLPELKALENSRTHCVKEGKRTLPGISDREDVIYGNRKVKGFIGFRKLIDEQMIQETEFNPYP